jgi:hypothetical protein
MRFRGMSWVPVHNPVNPQPKSSKVERNILPIVFLPPTLIPCPRGGPGYQYRMPIGTASVDLFI